MGSSARLAAALGLVALAFAQRGRFSANGGDLTIPVRNAEFHFLRVEYTDLPQFRRSFGFVSRNGQGNGWWMQDWPDADNHFSMGVGRLTRIDTGDPRSLRVTDDRLFDYPWIYATQTAYWDLSDAEVAKLREYLLRGGFLVVDDMWGEDQWELFSRTMNRVLPARPISALGESASVMHVLYDIQDRDRTFIPGSRHLRQRADGSIQIVQPPGTEPSWSGMFDDKDRMIVAVNFDTDVADAWEFADVPYYPVEMTTLAYRYGVNYIIYSMTH